MKKIIIFCMLVFVLAGSCRKPGRNMTVIRDCTGTYLELNGKHYQVCNAEKLAAYNDGEKVKATIKKIKDCDFLEGTIVCMMYHENEGFVKVLKLD